MRQVMLIMPKEGQRLPSVQEFKEAGFVVSSAVATNGFHKKETPRSDTERTPKLTNEKNHSNEEQQTALKNAPGTE